MKFSETEEETYYILEMYAALQASDPGIAFPGFDTEGEDASDEPYEGGHREAAESFRGVFALRLNPWPEKSHQRRLRDYRRMLEVWGQMGRKAILTANEVKRIKCHLRTVN